MRLVLVAFFLFSTIAGRAAPSPLDYLGSLKGEITLPALPPLSWTLTSTPSSDGRRSAGFSLEGDGITVRATLLADAETGIVSWKIDDARLRLDTWAGGLVARYAPSAGAVTASGEFTVTGEGTLAGFKPVGRLKAQARDLVARNSSEGWVLDGISFDGDFLLGPDLTLANASPFMFGIRTITTSRLGARAFSLNGRLESLDSLAVDSARIEIAGGEVTSGAFTAPLAPLSIETRVQIKRIGLQDFAQLFPSGLADARGRLDGELTFGWSPADGFKIGIGRLALDEFEPTVIRLAASPGFLTSRIPARFEFLPGALGRWLSIRNEAYDDLRAIEMGHTDLVVKSMRLALTPDGDADGRSARVFIDAGPSDQSGAVKQVVFNINVSGPLSQLLNLGMSETALSFDTH